MAKSKSTFDDLNLFVVELLQNQKADKETAVMIMQNLITDLLVRDTSSEQRSNPDLLIQVYHDRIKAGNLSYAGNLLGHWYRSRINAKAIAKKRNENN